MTRALFLLAVIVLAPLHASAQDDASGDPSVELFDRGVELLRESDYHGAAAAFRESYRLAPRVTTMCNLALTYDRWGPEHRAQAVRAYRTCARDDDTGRFRAFAERRVGEIERELVLLEVEGDEAGTGEADEAAEAAEQAVEPDEEDPVLGEPAEPQPEPRAEPDHALLYAGIGTGALALGSTIAGIVLALDAQSTLDALRTELGPTPVIVRGSPEHERLESARDAASAATALYVAAGVLAAGAATLIVIDLVRTSESETRVSISPIGVVLAGRF